MGPGRTRAVGLRPSLRSGRWDAWVGGLCASLALPENKDKPNRLGKGRKDLKGQGTHHSRGQAGKGGTRPALPGSTHPAAIAWRQDPPRPCAPQEAPTRGLALQSEGSCKLLCPRCLLLSGDAAPLPAPARAAHPCPPYLPGARVPAATPPWPWLRVLAPAAREPLLQNQAGRSEFPPPSPSAAGSSPRGEEATRNWLFESAPQPIVPVPAPLPSLPPAPGRDGGGAAVLHSPSSGRPPHRPLARESSNSGGSGWRGSSHSPYIPAAVPGEGTGSWGTWQGQAGLPQAEQSHGARTSPSHGWSSNRHHLKATGDLGGHQDKLAHAPAEHFCSCVSQLEQPSASSPGNQCPEPAAASRLG